MPKKILLIRHAIPDDSLLIAYELRPLTPIGKQIHNKMAHLLLEKGHKIDQIFYSPTERTKKSALLLADVFKVPAIEEKLLEQSYDEHLIYEKTLQQNIETIAFVGHAPSLFKLAQLLVPNNTPQFHLERSGVLIIKFDEEITWEYLSPKQVMPTLD